MNPSLRAAQALLLLALSVSACGEVSSARIPADGAGGAGSAGAGATAVEVRTLRLGELDTGNVSAAAFWGETLGVAAVVGMVRPRAVLFIAEGDGFVRHEYPLGAPVESVGLAGTNTGFVVAAMEPATQSRPGVLRVLRVAGSGELAQELDLAVDDYAPSCDIAQGGDTSAVACGSSVFALCGASSCRRVPLPECGGDDSARVVWDGKGFVFARSCTGQGGTHRTLRLSRISALAEHVASEVVVAEAELDPAFAGMAVGGRPGLAQLGDTAILAYRGAIYAVDEAGQVSERGELNPLAGYALPPQADGLYYEAELRGLDQHLIAASSWTQMYSLESTWIGHELEVLDAFVSLGKPLHREGDARSLHLAVSEGGRAVVAFASGSAVVVRDLDVAEAQLGPEALVEPKPNRFAVDDLLCEGSGCRVLLRTPEQAERSGPPFFDAWELSFDAETTGLPERGRSYLPCDSWFCSGHLTADGGLVVAGMKSVRWYGKDGSLAWSRDLPVERIPVSAIGRSNPYLVRFEAETVLALSEAEARSQPWSRRGSTTVMCPDSLYSGSAASDGIIQLEPVGPGTPMGQRPAALPALGETDWFCVGKQLMNHAYLDTRQRRTTLAGERLEDVRIPGSFVDAIAASDESDDIYVLSKLGAKDPTDWATDFVLTRVPLHAEPRAFTLTLPEAARPQALAVSPPYFHATWFSETALWVTSWTLPPAND